MKHLLFCVIIAFTPTVYAKSGVPCHGVEGCPTRALKTQKKGTCKAALMACDSLVKAQDNEIAGLKSNISKLEEELAKSTDNSLLFSPVVVGIIGVLGGFALGVLLAK